MTEDAARDWARTRTSDATAPPPAREQAVREAVAEDRAAGSGDEAAASAGVAATPGGGASVEAEPVPAPRAPLLVQGLLAALVGGVLTGAALLGTVPLVLALAAVQVLLAVAVLALLDAPAARGAAVVACLAAGAADAVVLADDRVDRLAGVVGLSLVASLLHQLVRRGRSRVTESLAATSLAVLAAVAAAFLLAVRPGGSDDLLLPALLAAAAGALLAGRLGDLLLPRARLARRGTRTWPGLAVSAVAGPAVALLVLAAAPDALGGEPWRAALLGLAAVVPAVCADLALDLGAGELRAGQADALRVRAVLPALVLLPYALLAPVAVLASALLPS